MKDEPKSLTARIALGDPEAFGEWVRNSISGVRAMVSKILCYHPSEVDDAVGDVLLNLWEATSKGKFLAKSKMTSWAFRVTKNRTLQTLRAGKSLDRSQPFVTQQMSTLGPGVEEMMGCTRSHGPTAEARVLIESLDRYFEAASSYKRRSWRQAKAHFLDGAMYKDMPGKEGTNKANVSRALGIARRVLEPRR